MILKGVTMLETYEEKLSYIDENISLLCGYLYDERKRIKNNDMQVKGYELVRDVSRNRRPVSRLILILGIFFIALTIYSIYGLYYELFTQNRINLYKPHDWRNVTIFFIVLVALSFIFLFWYFKAKKIRKNNLIKLEPEFNQFMLEHPYMIDYYADTIQLNMDYIDKLYKEYERRGEELEKEWEEEDRKFKEIMMDEKFDEMYNRR